MNRLNKLQRAQLKLFCKRSEMYQVRIHNDGETAERLHNLKIAQTAINQIACEHGYRVSWPGIDPLFTCVESGRNYTSVEAL